jgi:uncharacterized membrane protein YdfJ with MMPL/SSD domain
LSSERRVSFASLGRFTVRFRWLIVVAWVVGTVALTFGLPGISSVEKSSNSQFLPSTEPSVQADSLAAPFRTGTTSQAVLVAATDSGRLSAADEAAIAKVEAAIAKIPLVTSVSDRPW